MKRLLQKLRASPVLSNTFLLYALTASNALLGLVTQGIQARVLGTAGLGILGAAQYTTNFFQIFIDFGFITSATAQVSAHREDKPYLNRTLSAVAAAKLLFMLISAGVLLLFIRPTLSGPRELAAYGFYLLYVCTLAILPDFVYRGLERMSAITFRAVGVKLFATAMIFLFLRRPEDYWMVPMFSALGTAGAAVLVYLHLYRRLGLRFVRVSPGEVWEQIKSAAQFFLSKVSEAINANLGGVILSRVAGDAATGLYTNADKILITARNGMSPIAESLYPHMVRHRNFRLIKRALLLVYPVILLGCALVFVFARPLLVFWLGEEVGVPTVLPLRLLIPAAALSYPNFVLGYPTMTPMGLKRWANLSVTVGTAVYLLGLLLCRFTWGVDLFTLCVLLSVTEAAILLVRVAVIVKNRHLMRAEPLT